MSKIPLNRVLAAIDSKDYDFYTGLTPDEQKSVAPFLLNRYASLVQGSAELHAYYLLATNQRVNTQYFELARHPDLVWKLLCTVSPAMGTQRHVWVANKRRKKATSDHRKYIDSVYPQARQDELDWLYSVWSAADVREHKRQSGDAIT